MEISCNAIDRNLVVAIEGDIDHHSTEFIRERIEREFARADARNIIFDFNKVSFMDSSGIGMILGRYRALEQQGGVVAVAGISAEAFRIFEVSGLRKLIAVYADAETAAQSIAGQ